MRASDLLADQPARQPLRRQPRDLLLLPLRQPLHPAPPDRPIQLDRRCRCVDPLRPPPIGVVTAARALARHWLRSTSWRHDRSEYSCCRSHSSAAGRRPNHSRPASSLIRRAAPRWSARLESSPTSRGLRPERHDGAASEAEVVRLDVLVRVCVLVRKHGALCQGTSIEHGR